MSGARAEVAASNPASTPAVIGAVATELGEVVVTARKRNEKLRDIPTAITAFDADQIRDRGGISNVQSLVANVPGVNFSNTSNPVTSEVSMRGSGTSRATAAESGVGLYRNGSYLGGGVQGGRTFAKGDFFDAAGIEVSRGVQGALNGRNAVGGSINILSARPVQGESSGYVTAEVAQKSRREVQLVVNQPLSETLAIRLGVNGMQQTKGFFYAPIRGDYFDSQKTDLARLQLAYANGRLKANLLAEHGADTLPGLMYNVDIKPGFSPLYPKGLVDEKYNLNWNSPSTAKMRRNYFEFVGSYVADAATTTLTSSLRERHSQNAWDRDAVSLEFMLQQVAKGIIPASTAVGDFRLGAITTDFSRILYNDVHVAGAKVDGFSWLVGAEVYNLEDTVQTILSKTPAGTTAASLSPGTRQVAQINFTSTAAYGSVGYDITDRLNLTAEGRYTHDDKSIDAVRLDLGTGLPSGVGFGFKDGNKSNNVSYSLTTTYKLFDWLTYAKFGSAYRAGGFNLALGDPRAPKLAPATYDNETTSAFEIGAKGNLGSAIFITAAAYKASVDDLLVQTDNGCFVGSPVCPVSATNYVYNSGKAELSGIELEVAGRADILGGVARANYGVSRQWGRITSGPDKGRKGPQRPDWTNAFNLNYRRPIVAGVDGFINLKSNMRAGGVQEIAQTPNLHDYQIFDLRLGANIGRYEIAAYMNNLGDESYIVFDSTTVKRWNIPQTYGVQLRYNW
jgi:iron complex outermembrane receptor protein